MFLSDTLPPTSRPPRALVAAVACVAAALLLFEVVVTRLFSVLFYHHFSFFAISLVMSGLVIGGILAAQWDAAGMTERSFATRLTGLSAVFSVTTIAGILALVNGVELDVVSALSLTRVAVYATLFLPGLVAAGAFLALAFARNHRWVGRLYAADLIAASLACIAAIAALRLLSGPAAIVVVAGLAAAATVCTAPAPKLRWAGFGLVAVAAGLMGSGAAGSHLLRLKTKGEMPFVERWNEHSYVRVFAETGFRYIVIDRGAATAMRHLPPPATPDPSWKGDAQHAVYRVGRSFERAAIIGVGGGRDLLPAIFHGVKYVDGYEINGTMIDFLQRDFRDFNALATRPEIRLIHDDARSGIAHSGRQYDVIQASLIDTWAATASGGFVLSENSLYTREGWRVFLDHLTPSGILTMSRWHISDAPAETHRLVALAAASLADTGIADAASHIVLLQSHKSDGPVAFGGGETQSVGTILVSKSPFSADEIRRLATDSEAAGGELIAGPGVPSEDPGLQKLLDPATRPAAIAESPFNIEPPTDLQPHFFLQVRPGDFVNLRRNNFGAVTEITFNGVRVMIVLSAASLALVVLVAGLTLTSLPGSASTAAARRTYRWMTVYFLGIGLGYILVQLSLLQRLMIVLGRPTLALSVVLFSMLLGTGCGAAAAARLFPSGSLRRAMLMVVSVLVVLRLGFSAVPVLEQMSSTTVQIAIVGMVLFTIGFVLGCAFPLGVRAVAPTGEWAIQKMWAINGAASIAASVLAAIIGLVWGSASVLSAGVFAYVLALATTAFNKDSS
jgi:spermidine synthase